MACSWNPCPPGKGDVRDLGAAEQPGEGSEHRRPLRTAQATYISPENTEAPAGAVPAPDTVGGTARATRCWAGLEQRL